MHQQTSFKWNGQKDMRNKKWPHFKLLQFTQWLLHISHNIATLASFIQWLCVWGGGFTFTRHWNLSNDHRGAAANANPTRHLIVFTLILDCIMGRHTYWVQEHNRWTRGQHQDLQDTLGSHFWGLGSYTQFFHVSVPGQLLREHLQIAS